MTFQALKANEDLAENENWREEAEQQDCQIFLDTIYQNGLKCTKLPQHYKIVTTHGRKIFLTAIKFTNIFHSKALQNLPKLGFLV
jgi:hypothetical protein